MIAIRGLRKEYGAVVALDSLDLNVADGEVLALLGPSGCGKSTTLQLLAGFVAPSAGEILVSDRVLSRPGMVVPPERRGMSLIFQSYAIWPHMTVAENVAFGLQVRRIAKPEMERRIARNLAIVHLEHLAHRYPSELSGGQQQRVALARALVVDPDILLLDEPLSNLDSNLREEMRFEIRRLHDNTGITMVYVTHDQTEAMVCADRIAVMNKGRIEQVGTAAAIYEQPCTKFVASFIGRANTLTGKLVERGFVRTAASVIEAIDDTSAQAGSEVSVCIRPHHVALGVAPAAPFNKLQGRVERVAYLGEAIDYIVKLSDGSCIRALASPDVAHRMGEEVNVYLAIKHCRVVAA